MIATKEHEERKMFNPARRVPSAAQSEAAHKRMLSRWGEPLFLADWMRVLMIHFEVDATELQRVIPYELDLHDERAFVSLVAFSMENMRPRIGGKLGAWLFKPVATHDFLNVRTYVRHKGEPGIHFLAEWLSSRLAVQLGPRTFGLPYRCGEICYKHDWRCGQLHGQVADARNKTALVYQAQVESDRVEFSPCATGSLDEWLMERYTAFNSACGTRRYFRIWHPPWPQIKAQVELEDMTLLRKHWPLFDDARCLSANFSPGLQNVWMGRPHFTA